jgi:hypothetical protein
MHFIYTFMKHLFLYFDEMKLHALLLLLFHKYQTLLNKGNRLI